MHFSASSPGLRNMRDPGILDPRHFFSPRHFFLQRCKVLGELTTEKMLSAWVSAEVNDTFFENIKCTWERADAKNTSLPGKFYGYFESAWDSADVKNFFCQVIFLKIFKAPGIVWMQQTLFSRHFLWKY